MDGMLQKFRSRQVAPDLNRAQLMLQDHLANYQSVADIYNFTITNGRDILKKVGTSESVTVSREEIKRFLEESEGKKDEWASLWEHHKSKLEESVKICEFEQSISRVRVFSGHSYLLSSLVLQ